MKLARMVRLKTPQPELTDWIDAAAAAIDAARNLSHGGGPITIGQSPTGTSIGVAAFPVALAVSTSTITVRSGNTPGQGTATFKLFDVTGPVFSSDPALVNVKVYNWSSSTPAIPSGKWLFLAKINGGWFVISQEC